MVWNGARNDWNISIAFVYYQHIHDMKSLKSMNASDNIRVVLTYIELVDNMPLHGMFCRAGISTSLMKKMEALKRVMLEYGKTYKIRVVKREDDLHRYWNCGTDCIYQVVDFDFDIALGIPKGKSVLLCEHQIKSIEEN